MWPPTNVVGEHKRRANFIWVSLVMLIIGYSLWLIISTYQKRKNPTVNISIEDDRYAYPTITICATGGTAVGYGCDTVYYEYSCSSTIESYISNLGGFENINGEGYLQNDVNENEAYPYECVDLDLSDMSEVEGYTGLLPVGMGIWAQWDLNSDDADGTLENSEGAFVFFTDPDVSDPLGSHNMSTFVGIIPFTRQLAGDIPDNFIQTDITMKLTESMKLDGTNVKTYSAGTISSKEYLIPNWWIQDYYQDRAVMFMQIWQPGLSHTVRKEIDPLEWAEIVGNLGGAWEIILIMWGIFFIAKKRDEPELKGRDLVKTVQKGAQDVVRSASTIASRLNTKQGSGHSLPSERKEATPTWDQSSTDQGHRPPPAYDFSSDQNFAAGGTQYSRPTVDDFPRRARKPF